MKTDFEKWFISNHLTKEGNNYYFTVGARTVYVFFEGQRSTTSDTFINMRVISYDRERLATNARYHTGAYRFYIYGINALLPDKITDTLSNMLNEIIIEEIGRFRIHTGTVSNLQRGNKFYGSSHYENIVSLDYQYWEQ
ncbi:MAG: hypothetical protein COA92_04175 [Sulfurovum sp.]|nr:MAG: hypothetical protein COA92_04175 [Sulfurovum sp.]